MDGLPSFSAFSFDLLEVSTLARGTALCSFGYNMKEATVARAVGAAVGKTEFSLLQGGTAPGSDGQGVALGTGLGHAGVDCLVPDVDVEGQRRVGHGL